jgi:hypothetical protein
MVLGTFAHKRAPGAWSTLGVALPALGKDGARRIRSGKGG